MANSGLRAIRLRRMSERPVRMRLVVCCQCYGLATALELNCHGAAPYREFGVTVVENRDEPGHCPLPRGAQPLSRH